MKKRRIGVLGLVALGSATIAILTCIGAGPLSLACFLFAIPAIILGIIALATREYPFWNGLAGLIVGLAAWIISIAIVLGGGLSSGRPSDEIRSTKPSPIATKTETPATEPSSVEPSSPPPPPITEVVFQGDGELTTAKQRLIGDYQVTFEILNGCFYAPTLRSDDGNENLPTAQDPQTITSYVYGLQGDYFVDMITGPSPRCGWRITFTPL